MTSQYYFGNLKTQGNAATGIEGGDALCNLLAAAAGIGGTWKVWLSDSTTDAIDRIVDVSPWYFVNKTTKVFANKASLAVKPLVAVDMDETGALIGNGIVDVFTGTGPTGRKLGGSCVNWTTSLTAAGPATCGTVQASSAAWTDTSTLGCNYGAHLYCFEQ